MKRTGPAVLIGAAVIGLVIGFVVDQLLTLAAQPTLTPAITLPIVLALLAAACLLFAWPIRQSLRRKRDRAVDPHQAYRVVTLARASSILGALTAGFGVGLMLFLFTRPIPAPIGSLTIIGVTVGAGVVLLIAALVAESFCALPKDDDDDPTRRDSEPRG